MEININCDLGEKSKHHSNKYDPDLLKLLIQLILHVVIMLVMMKQ